MEALEYYFANAGKMTGFTETMHFADGSKLVGHGTSVQVYGPNEAE